ncbi:MAG TPA: redox-sensing transcriptional repressor Rex [Treponemataceae bacterium]|nr:MAG: Redox-sensing transcriptional repressor Rex [Spirochaetes bacterium ADurb.Bin215]HPA10331.1 redox-sensing transcriptional repressor Rex [Treponemataceae bacterium]HPX14742.1 redox-sensing transcriptional repressor Rex [Treponemataceae bacterium]HQB88413.1 redox-sensing transcriptional repressor Rex [Treponemataceae bacterium]
MGIPRPTAERLSRLAYLLEQQASDNKPLTSAEMEQLTGWPSHTIRKDISVLGRASGIATKNGYPPRELAAAIRETLGFTETEHNCCIVGLGRIGSAFLDYTAFNESPFTIRAGFDSNVNRIEILKAEFPLYPTFKMKDVIPRLDIRYAILTVPPDQAAQAAEKLISCGIRGIVNFTPVILPAPPGVEIEQVSILDALGAVAARLATTTKE